MLLSRFSRFEYASCNFERISIEAAAVLKVSSRRDLRYAVTAANECKLSVSSAGPAGHGAGPGHTTDWYILL